MMNGVESTSLNMIVVRRVLSRLTVRSVTSGPLTFDLYSTPSEARVVDRNNQLVGVLSMAQVDAIIREESERARNLTAAG